MTIHRHRLEDKGTRRPEDFSLTKKPPRMKAIPKEGIAMTDPDQLLALLGGSSLPCSITEVNCTIAKAAFCQKFELQSQAVGQG